MKAVRKLDNLLTHLAERIFLPLGVEVPLVFAPATAADRAAMVASDRRDWLAVDRNLVWGEPDGYYWFGGTVVLPGA
ncbi:MAG: hypothetical protein QMD99_00960, partial [Rhizobiaceae bacterium]|nr:hypothetical protein [Rhizobiaceae bacterium]